jgi:alpha-2-macroglobulin-like protein
MLQTDRALSGVALAVAVVCVLAAAPPVQAATPPAPADKERLSLLLYAEGATVGGRFPLTTLSATRDLAEDVAARIAAYTHLATTVSVAEQLDGLSPAAAPVLLIGEAPGADDVSAWLSDYMSAGGFVVLAPDRWEGGQELRDWLQAVVPTRPLAEASHTALTQHDDLLPDALRATLTGAGNIDALRMDGEVRLAAPRSVSVSEAARGGERRVVMAAAMALAGALRSHYAQRLSGNPIEVDATRYGDYVFIGVGLTALERDGIPTVTLTNARGAQWTARRLNQDEAKYAAEIADPMFDPAAYWAQVSWPGQPRLERVVRLSDIMGSLDMEVLGQDVWSAGSPAAVRVIVRDSATGEPSPGATIEARVVAGESTLARVTARSDAAGSADIRFPLPPTFQGDAALVVEVGSRIGDDVVRQDIRVLANRKTLLTTDKPIYQPGQRIHLRSLTLRAGDLAAIGGDRVTFEVEDAKGNKVFKRPAARNAFGVASAQFDLADEVNMGVYTVRVVDGEWSQEKALTVERYVLPKFRVTVEFDRADYGPGDVVTGAVQADYLFGKPVAGGSVHIVASKFDVGWDRFSRIDGHADDSGSYAFELDLPTYFAGLPLDAGDSFVQFEVTVTDGATHEETVTATRPVTRVPLQVVLAPESGALAAGLVNELYAVVTTPKGDPVAAGVTVTLGGVTREAASDAMGVATFTFRPKAGNTVASVVVRTPNGDTLRREIALDEAADGLLLRPSVALARVGDVVAATVHSPRADGWVYLDVIRRGQTVRTRSAVVRQHNARMSFAIEAEDVGTLELHAYQPGIDGEMRRDTRLVHVSPADDLTLDVRRSADVYQPGEEADIRFHVTDAAGHPVMAALGIHIVDESVFARQEMQPGLERVFFLLEEELMRPKIEIHGFTPHSVAETPPTDEPISARREQAARVLFAAAEGVQRAHSISIRTRPSKGAAIAAELRRLCHPLVERVLAAVAAHMEARGRPLRDDNGGLTELVRGGFLTREDMLDPWGGAVVYTDGRLRTPGPDRVLGTPDDPDLTDVVPRAGGRAVDRLGAVLHFGARIGAAGPVTSALLEARMDAESLVTLGAPGVAYARKASTVVAADVAPTRVREFFPETLLSVPSLFTDAAGDATLSVPLADSITTWRMTSMASAMDGRLGSISTGIRVFQDFFVDLDLPVALTVGDEVSVPVALYNYLDGPQTVRLELEPADWFEVSGPSEIVANLAASDVSARYFRIKATKPGRGALTVRAFGSEMSDAIRRTVDVAPDGRRVEVVVNGRVSNGDTHTLRIPEGAVADSARLVVRLHPGVFSQIVDGLDAVLQMPFGCFEQTSSTTYPNILALQYMRATGQNTPDVQMKAQQYIGLGYQRLVSFEVDGGGFEWFGNAPANTVLTAYGLLEFTDMAEVHEVDPDVIARTRHFLLTRQIPDGSWLPDPVFLHAESWGRIQDSALLPTAYVTWVLAASGLAPAALTSAVGYLRENWESADEAYTLAILANALVAAAPQDRVVGRVLDRLAGMATVDGESAHWGSDIPTITHARGPGATLETTAMAALALARADTHPPLLERALQYLVEARDSRGTWHTTQATILALKALLAGSDATASVDADVTVRVDGAEFQRLTITPDDSDVTRLIDIGAVSEGTHTVSFEIDGRGSPLFQAVARYHVPWDAAPLPVDGSPADTSGLAVSVRYDRTTMEKDDTVGVECRVENTGHSPAMMVVVDIGVPPGFAVDTSDFEAMVAKGVINKYQVTPRQIIVYFDQLKPGLPTRLDYHLRARYPVRAKTRPTKVYEYYNPMKMALEGPVDIVVLAP